MDTRVYPVDRVVQSSASTPRATGRGRHLSKIDQRAGGFPRKVESGQRASRERGLGSSFALLAVLFCSGTWLGLAVRTRSSSLTPMDVLALTTHRQRIMTRTQIGMWLGAATRRTRLRMEGKWSAFATKPDCAWATLGGMVQAIDLTALHLGRNAR